MSLPTSHRRSVTFVGTGKSGGARRLRGTGFFVGVPTDEENSLHLYLVTASHVVPPYEPTFMRLRRLKVAPPPGEPLDESKLDEDVVDVDLGTWHRHPTRDIAAVFVPDPDPWWAVGAVELDQFVDVSPHEPYLGEDVFFAGLLAQAESMADRHVPMLRGGMIGALYQDDIPMVDPGGAQRRLDGHLIDCRSFGGFSGAPCFARLVRAGDPTPRLGLPTSKHIGCCSEWSAAISTTARLSRSRATATAFRPALVWLWSIRVNAFGSFWTTMMSWPSGPYGVVVVGGE